MKILVWRDGGLRWDASTPGRERAALRYLFLELDEGQNCYGDGRRLDEREERWLEGARAGRHGSTIRLLAARRHLDGERWSFEEVLPVDGAGYEAEAERRRSLAIADAARALLPAAEWILRYRSLDVPGGEGIGRLLGYGVEMGRKS